LDEGGEEGGRRIGKEETINSIAREWTGAKKARKRKRERKRERERERRRLTIIPT
jgi:hypothetical protein